MNIENLYLNHFEYLGWVNQIKKYKTQAGDTKYSVLLADRWREHLIRVWFGPESLVGDEPQLKDYVYVSGSLTSEHDQKMMHYPRLDVLEVRVLEGETLANAEIDCQKSLKIKMPTSSEGTRSLLKFATTQVQRVGNPPDRREIQREIQKIFQDESEWEDDGVGWEEYSAD